MMAFAAGALLLSYATTASASLGTDNNALWNEEPAHIEGDPETLDAFGTSVAAGDFDNDGNDDLAIGVPGKEVGARAAAGLVHVLYAPSGGDASTMQQVWDQGPSEIPGSLEANDHFGQQVATGDFNNDGFDDLAIGATGDDGTPFGNNTPDNAGSVTVLYGSASGLTDTGVQFWDQNTTGVNDEAEPGDLFGAAMISGDFNADGRDDLAIGVPGEALEGRAEAGAVNVLYGSMTGLAATGINRIFYQGLGTMHGFADANDRFGESLAAGDFDNDGDDDLVVGVPGEGIDVGGAGAIAVLLGMASDGLQITGNLFLHKNVPPPNPPLPPSSGLTQEGAAYGTALAAGYFNADNYADIAIGVPGQLIGRPPGEDFGGEELAGQVTINYGSAQGLVGPGTQFFNQNDIAGGEAEEDDHFGNALAAADYDGDGRDDLAIGAPREDISIWPGVGEFDVIYGTDAGLATTKSQRFSEVEVSALVGAPDTSDHLGQALAAGDFNGDGAYDVAAGEPNDKIGLTDDVGSVVIVYGDEPPPAPTNTPTITPTSPPTSTPTPTVPGTATPVPTNTPIATNTPVDTATSTPTNTQVPPTDTPTPDEVDLGDIDCDGEVTSIDAALELQFIAGLLSVLPCEDAADVNDDGLISSVDVALILQFIAGLIDEF
jgi:hypothetical protein